MESQKFIRYLLAEHLLRQEVRVRGINSLNDYHGDLRKNLLLMQDRDVPVTYTNTSDLERDITFKPGVSVKEDLNQFVKRRKSCHASF